MDTIKAILGYTMAGLSFVLIVVLLPSLGALAEPLIEVTGLTVSPNFSGGEVVQTVDHGTYRTEVHRMVFDDTLIGQRRKGFIQVDWTPADALPARFDEEIDANGDGQADFRVAVDVANATASVTPHAPWVLDLEGPYKPEDRLIVRVRLKNPSR